MGLRLVNHGGMCCGIKTIYGFPTGLDYDEQDELEVLPPNNADIRYYYQRSDVPFFTDPAPEESTSDRLDRYIDFVKKHRPSHVIEAVLCEAAEAWRAQDQLKLWGPRLIRRGFVDVTQALNSNSGNRIHIYHLVIE